MTPEEIKKLLLQSKTEGLSGATVADLQRQTADPMWRPKTAKAAHRSELAKQAVTGLQNAMGPAAMLMPSMGMLAEGAPTAIGLGAELGDVAKKGFVSNSNFDNTMLAMLGVSGMPLLGKKGEGKLYSKAVALADEQGLDLAAQTPTFLNRWFKKNNIKPAEVKAFKNASTTPMNADGLYPADVSGKVHSYNNYEYDGQTPTIEASVAFQDVTFPDIVAELKQQNGEAVVPYDVFDINNILINPHVDTGGKRYTDHWGGEGPIHARVGYAPTKNDDKMIGILAEVQSDAAKKINSSELPKTTFLSDYPNIATKQGLLQLIQQSDANLPGKPLQVVWPSGQLQRKVNHSGSTAYDNIYDKRVTKAISEALGDDAVIEQMGHPAFTPLHNVPKHPYQFDIEYHQEAEALAATKGFVPTPWHIVADYGVPEYIKPDVLAKLKDPVNNDVLRLVYTANDDYNIKLDGLMNIYQQTQHSKSASQPGGVPIQLVPDIELPASWLDKIADDQELTLSTLFGDDYVNTSTRLQTTIAAQIAHLLGNKAAKDYASTKAVKPITNLFSTTIPAEKVSRLAKDGIPLWMLPIGMGISSQMSYNKESPQQ